MIWNGCEEMRTVGCNQPPQRLTRLGRVVKDCDSSFLYLHGKDLNACWFIGYLFQAEYMSSLPDLSHGFHNPLRTGSLY